MALRDMSDNFPIIEGTLLASRYEVQAFLGEGSFGKVAKCVDTSTNTYSAIKITKDHPIIAAQALEEIKILKELQSLDPDECNFVRWAGLFYHQRFICLQFELLDLSLRDYMKERHYQPLSVQCIRPVLHQAFYFLPFSVLSSIKFFDKSE
ncbi:homeodomain-interacting protein kinase 1-like [Mugil cephalus]|uniref:homeodomain-interacting protein kinase 1-like n=1 Tax=Mugil cephalus TaxID=48193 RepID=UPI001FB763AD|nr:homeodomain-interacting protein kinase 1-like [Mugil cephalus]